MSEEAVQRLMGLAREAIRSAVAYETHTGLDGKYYRREADDDIAALESALREVLTVQSLHWDVEMPPEVAKWLSANPPKEMSVLEQPEQPLGDAFGPGSSLQPQAASTAIPIAPMKTQQEVIDQFEAEAYSRWPEPRDWQLRSGYVAGCLREGSIAREAGGDEGSTPKAQEPGRNDAPNPEDRATMAAPTPQEPKP